MRDCLSGMVACINCPPDCHLIAVRVSDNLSIAFNLTSSAFALSLSCILTCPRGSPKYAETHKNTQLCYTLNHVIRCIYSPETQHGCCMIQVYSNDQTAIEILKVIALLTEMYINKVGYLSYSFFGFASVLWENVNSVIQ